MTSEWVSTDAIAEVEVERVPPYVGSQVNPPWETYIEPGMTPVVGAPMPDDIWLLADYDPLFYVGLMAKYGYTINAWKTIKNPPQPIKPYIPPRPVPVYIGIETGVGEFTGQSAPEFSA
jgi:hypothetical protein